jgi:hypothetical protein
MKHIFTSKDNIPHVLFTDYRYYINGKSDQKIFQEMIYLQKWSNDLITLIIINKTINFRVHEMWDLIFNLTVYSKLQMLDNSSKLPV